MSSFRTPKLALIQVLDDWVSQREITSIIEYRSPLMVMLGYYETKNGVRREDTLASADLELPGAQTG